MFNRHGVMKSQIELREYPKILEIRPFTPPPNLDPHIDGFSCRTDLAPEEDDLAPAPTSLSPTQPLQRHLDSDDAL